MRLLHIIMALSIVFIPLATSQSSACEVASIVCADDMATPGCILDVAPMQSPQSVVGMVIETQYTAYSREVMTGDDDTPLICTDGQDIIILDDTNTKSIVRTTTRQAQLSIWNGDTSVKSGFT